MGAAARHRHARHRRGRYLIRVAIGGELTEHAHIDTRWAEPIAAAEAESGAEAAPT
ncbi:hypothetical protein G443_001819 [Actinoalloteichus cyanogriseus DSM 43889]|uniref:Uncharacterized protein n=1 Tax=Actinoalloteichus caeruleus DSM 43889 TaxID=1120930 RepID=A0ABT1JGW7_ACTCY|nr:hypothetical protein [Actinoalloteichus caeruleus DSM 43889]